MKQHSGDHRLFMACAAALVIVFHLYSPPSLSAKAADDRYFSAVKGIELLGDVYREVAENYVDTLSISRLSYSAIDGMLEPLDPYTVFLDEEQSRELGELTNSQYAGIGITIASIEGSIFVTSVEKGWPAAKAGMRVGDRITEINGVQLKKKSLDRVRELIKGNAGVPLALAVARRNSGRLTFRLLREEIRLSTVTFSGLVDGFGYIGLESFGTRSFEDVQKALAGIREEAAHSGSPPKGIILDLRENPGGLLDAAVDVTSLFVPEESPVVSIRGRSAGSTKSYTTKRPPEESDIPLAILINARSASAAEIVSGAVQDLDRGILIGERSFGKGLVQSVINLPYDSALKLTTAKYYTPSGRLIQKEENGALASARDVLTPRKRDGDGHEVFRTAAKRKVYGGGGIAPDITVEAPGESAYLDQLRYRGMLFLFSLEQAASGVGASPDSAALMPAFNHFLENHDFSYRSADQKRFDLFMESFDGGEGGKKSLQVLEAGRDELERLRKMEVAGAAEDVAVALREEIVRLCDPKAARRLELARDPLFRKAAEVLSAPRQYARLLRP
ncbi:S41 family peptidase [Chlorobium phaeovibrioides]|uniref:S41 family peptidase n=1 Tax=Chlorobium phaeovibrioides TaxID=1094 RepID=A0A5M8I833_CHLPH|nr:S41 family peptidase [Chlorobium phaeovibrioides]KAA6231686.1 S41 family peptidase [Chlorobium phaeovibrioides]